MDWIKPVRQGAAPFWHYTNCIQARPQRLEIAWTVPGEKECVAIRLHVDHDAVRLHGKENSMSRDVIKSHWPRLQGKLRAKWTKLTWEDVSFGEGDRTYLIGRLKDRYSLDDATATMRVAAFERLLS